MLAGAAARVAELPGGGVGEVAVTPIVAWLFAHGGGFEHGGGFAQGGGFEHGGGFERGAGLARFSQSVVLGLPVGVDGDGLARAVQAVLDRHDMLRARLVGRSEAGWRLVVPPVGSVAATELIRRVVVKDVVGAEFSTVVAAELAAAQGRLDPVAGVMVQLVWLAAAAAGVAGRLLVVVHHLVVDGVSWRIVVPDLAAAWAGVAAGGEAGLAPVGTSMRRWAHGLVAAARAPGRVAELELWRGMVGGADPVLGTRRVDPAVDVGATVDTVTVEVSAPVTEAVLTTVPARFHGGVDDGLLTGLAVALGLWRRGRGVAVVDAVIAVEGHGREEQVLAGADLSRTVGWFTTMFPVRLALAGIDLDEVLAGGAAAGAAVKAVKEQMRAVPGSRYRVRVVALSEPGHTGRCWRGWPSPQVGFNYLGRFEHRRRGRGRGGLGAGALGRWGRGCRGAGVGGAGGRRCERRRGGYRAGPVLRAGFAFPTGVLTAAEVGELARRWSAALAGLARHVAAPDAGGLTPSDLPLVQLDQTAIEALEARYPGLREVWPLAPLQAGLLFHALLADRSVDAYLVQLVLELRGPAGVGRGYARRGRRLLDRHANLRAGFVAAPGGEFVQVVADGVELPWAEADLSGLDAAVREEELERLLARDRATRFDLATAPLLRVMLVGVGAGEYRLVLTNHHILLDGWSMPLLVRELLVLYAAGGDGAALPRVRPYRDYLVWLAGREPRRRARRGPARWRGSTSRPCSRRRRGRGSCPPCRVRSHRGGPRRRPRR